MSVETLWLHWEFFDVASIFVLKLKLAKDAMHNAFYKIVRVNHLVTL